MSSAKKKNCQNIFFLIFIIWCSILQLTAAIYLKILNVIFLISKKKKENILIILFKKKYEN